MVFGKTKVIVTVIFQHRPFDYAGLGLHQGNRAGFVADGDFFRIGELAPGGSARVDQSLPPSLRHNLAQPGRIDALFPEIVESDI